MSKRLFVTTAVGLIFGTAALAQAPNNPPSVAPTGSPPVQNQTNSAVPARSQPAPSAQNSAPGNTATQVQSQTGAAAPQSPTSGRSDGAAPSRAEANPVSGNPVNGNTTNANPSNTRSQAQTDPANAPSQAQTTAPAGTSSQSQNSNAAPANNQVQQAPSRGGTSTAAQQPNGQENAARANSANVNASVNINSQQRTRISQSITRLNVRPLTKVNFSLSVGTTIPRDVRLEPLPDEVVQIVPQYRGYDFVVVRDEIVIVEPSSTRIVAVLPRSGGSTAAAESPRRKVTFSDRDRELIRKHARSNTERRTTGSTASARIRMGDRIPESVTIEEFPEEIYRESPGLREYRYIQREDRTYVVEPGERRIIEEID